MTTISVVLISFNEAARIERCLRRLDFADEIIVVDSESTDETREIARRFTSHVHIVPWKGFGGQKNHAIDLATGEWVLSLDCDEYVSPELASEMRRVVEHTECAGFTIPFRSMFLGKPVRYGSWGRQTKLRLFRRNHGKFTEDAIHERLVVDGPVGDLTGSINHDTCPTLQDMRRKQLAYAAIGAQDAIDQGRTATLTSAACRASAAFLKSYVMKAGVLDGRTGWSLATCLGHSTWIKYRWIAEGRVPDAYRCASG